MSGDNNKKFAEFTKKILKKIQPRFSFHYVAYTTLFTFVIFSVVSIVTATTPNPGHPWAELGDGVFTVANTQTVNRTYTFPDANATVLTTNALVTVAQGGTGVGTLTGIVKGNGTGAFSTVVSGTDIKTINGSSILGSGDLSVSGMTWPAGGAGIPNYSGSSSWGTSYTTTGSGTVLALATTPTFTTNITTPLILGGSSTTSPLTFQTTSGVGTTGADMHFKVGNNGGTEAMTILNNGNVGIGQSSPTALLHLKAGTATVGTSPLKLTAGTPNTTAEAGAIEYDGSSLFFTNSTPARKTIAMEDGFKSYYDVPAWIPNSNQTISSSGTTVTITNPVTYKQFDWISSLWVGSKIIINGETRYIVGRDSDSQVTVNSAYSQNYTNVSYTNWRVYALGFNLSSDGNPYFYSGTQQGGATAGSLFLSNQGGYVNTAYAYQIGSTAIYGYGVELKSDLSIAWSNNSTDYGDVKDLGLRRSSAGILEIYDGNTAGAFRDLNLRTLNASTSVVSPVVLGGSSTTSTLTFQTTSGVGTTGSDMHFKVGNNGGTEAMTILNNGKVGIGTNAPEGSLHIYNGNSGVNASTNADDLIIEGNGPAGISILSPDGVGEQNINFGSLLSADGNINYNSSNNRLTLSSSASSSFYISTDQLLFSTIGVNFLISGSNRYLNFNTISGTTGYGFRDNAGIMEYKNSGGSWSSFGGGSMTWPAGGAGIPNYSGSSSWGTSYTTSGSGTVLALATTPTFTTNITTPLVLGGSSTTSPLTFQTTSGVGTTGADMHFKVGNNGGTEALTILNNGNVGIGLTNPSTALDVNGMLTVGTGAGITRTGSILLGDGYITKDYGQSWDFGGGIYTHGGGLGFGRNDIFFVRDSTGTDRDIFGARPATDPANSFMTFLRSPDNDSDDGIQFRSYANSPLVTILNGGNVGIGTTSPSYKLDIKGLSVADGVNSDMGFNINQVPDPTVPTAAVSAGGSVDTGAHWYAVTYITATGETHSVFTDTQVTTTAGNNTVTLTIPTSSDPRVTGRKIYRSKAGAGDYEDYYVGTVANNTATTYVDTVADSALTGSSSASYYRTNTTSQNISINGNRALTADTNATYFGYQAGAAITSGGRNTFVGWHAGYASTTGKDNTFIGHQAGGIGVVTGLQNTYIGTYTGRATTSGSSNVAIGHSALSSNTTGYSNIAIGQTAGYYIADGSTSNTASNTSIFIGRESKALADSQANQIVLGYQAIGNGSNTVTIGNSSNLRTYLAGLNLKAGSATAGTAPIKLTAGTNLGTTEAGAIEYNGTHLYFTATNGGTRYQLDQQSGGSSQWTTTGSDIYYDTGRAFIGSTTESTSASRLALTGTNTFNGSTAGVIGILGNYTFNNGGASNYVQVGNRLVITNSPTTNPNTAVGETIRIVDSSGLANLVRGLDITVNAGSNTAGTNVGLRASAATFGIQGLTSGLAGGVALPAALYGENTGTTLGNVLRLFSNTMTSAQSFATFYHDTSTFTGTGLLMNFATGSGSFTGNFADFQKNNVSLFKVTNAGILSMGLSSTSATSAICSSLANGSAPTAGVAYEIRDCSSTPVADYAEMYPVESGIEYGDIVATGTETVNTYDESADGGIDWNKVKSSISKLTKSNASYQKNVIGIVSNNHSDFSSVGYNIKNEDNPMPIALNGRVPVKVSSSSESIEVGDYLTTSEDLGRAVKATKAGFVIGKALEAWDASSGKNTVMVFVDQGYYNGPELKEATFSGLTFFEGDAKFIKNVVFNSQVEFNIPPLFNKDTAGFAIIKKGTKEVKVTFDTTYIATPVVNTTITFEKKKLADGLKAAVFDSSSFFSNDIKSIVVDKDETGFTIVINKNATEDIQFSWIALAVKDPNIFESVIDGLVIEDNSSTTIIPSPKIILEAPVVETNNLIDTILNSSTEPVVIEEGSIIPVTTSTVDTPVEASTTIPAVLTDGPIVETPAITDTTPASPTDGAPTYSQSTATTNTTSTF